VEGNGRVTTAVVGLLIALCALLLVKWLALLALASVALLALLRFALRRAVRAIRARRSARDPGVPTHPGAAPSAAVLAMTTAPDCSWCGLRGGHVDMRGRPVRPRHAHALPAPSRRAS